MERSDPPPQAPIVQEDNWFQRFVGWCIGKVLTAIWRVLVRPVLVAVFSPLWMVWKLADVKFPERSERPASDRVSDEETNPAGSADGNLAKDQITRDSEGRKDHG